MKYETYRGVEPSKMGAAVDFYEVDTLTFDKSVVLRVQAYTQGKKLFWTEATRTRADMGKPLVMTSTAPSPDQERKTYSTMNEDCTPGDVIIRAFAGRRDPPPSA
jgi:hypothetical protein